MPPPIDYPAFLLLSTIPQVGARFADIRAFASSKNNLAN